MATMGEFGETSARFLPEAVARTLRHEVGDLLQTIYAAVAILQKRLAPEATVERHVLADLRNHAEGCKRLLDNVTDLVSPLSLSLEQVDLAQLAASLVAKAAPSYRKLEIRAASSFPLPVPADEKRIAQVGEVLLTQACEAAQRQVWFRTSGRIADEEVEWAVIDDRPNVATEQLEQIFRPDEMIRQGSSGIGLALAQRLVLLHGGRIDTEKTANGGFCVLVRLPTKAPAVDSLNQG